jgi:glutamyl-tRNA reductase
MNLHLIGCSHRTSPLTIRERLAFDSEQVGRALCGVRHRFPHIEAVLLSTCNRVELYLGSPHGRALPDRRDVERFLAEFHNLGGIDLEPHLIEQRGREAVRHLFLVAASLDSMVMGEAQILSQVKQAYQLAVEHGTSGPVVHGAFQAAIRTARRVSNDTSIHQKRVSIPSVAVGDFAKQIFERLDDKHVLVLGAGEMGEETLRYLMAEGSRKITVVNRSFQRAQQLAVAFGGQAAQWDQLPQLLVDADLIVSTTGAREGVISLEQYRQIEPQRFQRTLFILDLAVPRDVDPRIGDCLGVYLYSIDDLKAVCDANQQRRRKEWPQAVRIVDQELKAFLEQWSYRGTAPTIRCLRKQAEQIKRAELERLCNKLGPIDERTNHEIQMAFDRLVNKMLHAPLASLRDEAQEGPTAPLLEAVRRLFRLEGDPER